MTLIVRDVMTDAPRTIRPEATLQEAAETMRMLDVGPLPVCDAVGDLVGILTDRDVTVRATSEGRDPHLTLVRDVMTTDVAFVYDDQRLSEAARVLQQRRIRRLPVLERERRNLVGILSLADIALTDLDEDLAAETLESVSEPTAPNKRM